MYVLDRSTGAVYRIETTGGGIVIYQPGSDGLSGSAAQHVTGRADVIQIIDSDNRLYQVRQWRNAAGGATSHRHYPAAEG